MQGRGAREDPIDGCTKDERWTSVCDQAERREERQDDGQVWQGHRHVENKAVEETVLTGIVRPVQAAEGEVGPEGTEEEEGQR
jgi:hypothetical protein